MKPKISGKGRLSKKHGAVLSRLLKGKGIREIARELNISVNAVDCRRNIFWPYISEKTERLIELRKRSSHNKTPSLDSTKLVEALDQELKDNPNPRVLSKLAQDFNVSPGKIVQELRLAGILFHPEIQRKRLAYWKEVARVSQLHLDDQIKILQIRSERVTEVQRQFQQGYHIKEVRTFLKELIKEGWWKSNPLTMNTSAKAIRQRDWQVKEDLALLDVLEHASSNEYKQVVGLLCHQYAVNEYAFRQKNRLPIPNLIATMVEVDST